MHSLTALQALAMLGAGLLAGTINAIVGSGSLITFPVLLGLGLSPLVANVSNNVGLMMGSASSVHGYRRELQGQLMRVLEVGPWSAAGGLTGAALLLYRPSSFRVIVPYLVLLAVVMVIAQPTVSKKLAQRQGTEHEHGGYFFKLCVFATGIYGGYFGAAQGVILIAILAISLDDGLQRLNALKNVCALFVNGVAGILFIILAPVNWTAAIFIAVGSVLGGQLGAKLGRRLPAKVFAAIIVIGGTAVAIHLILS